MLPVQPDVQKHASDEHSRPPMSVPRLLRLCTWTLVLVLALVLQGLPLLLVVAMVCFAVGFGSALAALTVATGLMGLAVYVCVRVATRIDRRRDMQTGPGDGHVGGLYLFDTRPDPSLARPPMTPARMHALLLARFKPGRYRA
ncbi:MAG: hypothetical protein KDK91_00840 [Gammaproteobacteria bacterium]|nr:hypothetical protein [Gammaproteobacteria bacterium]